MTFYFARILILFIVLLPPYILIRWLWTRKKGGEPNRLREILLAAFVLFSAALLDLVFDIASGFSGGRPGQLPSGDFSGAPWLRDVRDRILYGWGINFVPFRTISDYFRAGDAPEFFVNIVGNVLMFVPVGFFPPLLFLRYRSFPRALISAALIPFLIESVQLFLWRSVDVDDLILNSAGILLGWVFARILQKKESVRKLSR